MNDVEKRTKEIVEELLTVQQVRDKAVERLLGERLRAHARNEDNTEDMVLVRHWTKELVELIDESKAWSDYADEAAAGARRYYRTKCNGLRAELAAHVAFLLTEL